MVRGHVTGKKREKPHASDWYRAIEAQRIQEVEAMWAPGVQPKDEKNDEGAVHKE